MKNIVLRGSEALFRAMRSIVNKTYVAWTIVIFTFQATPRDPRF
jgi:hypothetical protein